MRRIAIAAVVGLGLLAACSSKTAKESAHVSSNPHDDPPPRDLSGSDMTVDPTTAICGEVRVKSELAPKVTPSSVLFVFAKPQPGGGAPAAVIRRDAPTFPTRFCLSQKNAMAPSVIFAGQQFLTARVEFDMSAGGQPGDLETVTKEPITVGAKDVVLTIDTVRP